MGTLRPRLMIAGLLVPVICSASAAGGRPSAPSIKAAATSAAVPYAIVEDGTGFVIRSRGAEPERAAAPVTPLIPLGNGLRIDRRLVAGATHPSKEARDADH